MYRSASPSKAWPFYEGGLDSRWSEGKLDQAKVIVEIVVATDDDNKIPEALRNLGGAMEKAFDALEILSAEGSGTKKALIALTECLLARGVLAPEDVRKIFSLTSGE